MADEVASLLVRITADGSQAVGVLNGVASTVTTLADKNASLMNKVAATGNLAGSVGRTITKTFGVATVAGLVASAKAAGQLNKELANIGTLSVPTERLQEFKGQIQDVAIATGKSTSDISEGTYQVISAFGDAPDTMEKVEINAKAATAGLATTADSIALTSAVTKAYGDTSAGATQQVADLAFKTVELGQTTFPELAQNMQQVTSLSKELGVSQEELFGAYATLTGVTGNAAEVQTQMKAVYTALLKPSENMQAAISKLGYSSGFAMIKTLGFAGTLKALKSATNGSEEQMLGLFNNVRAMPAVMALTGAQSDVFAEKLEKMKNASGAATKAFEVQTEGIAKTGFTLEQAKVKMQVAAQNFGESAAPIIADFADVVDKVATKLSSMSDEERKAVINTGLLITKAAAGLAVGDKVITFGTKVAGVVGTIASLGPVAGIAATGIAGIAAAAVAGKVAYDKWYEINYKFADGLNEQAQAMRSSGRQWKELNELRLEYNDLTGKINSNALEGEALEKAKARIDEIVQLLKDKYQIDVDSGGIDEALEKAEGLRKLTYQQNQHEMKTQLDEGRFAYNKAVNERLPKAKKEYEEAAAAAEQYEEAQRKIYNEQNAFDRIKASATPEERNAFRENIKNILSETDIPQKLGENWSEQLFMGLDNSQSGEAALAELQRRLDMLNVDKLKGEYEGLDEQVKAYKDAASQYADTIVDDFEAAAKAGASDKDLGNYIRGIKSLVDDNLISMDEYAKKLALAKSGQESVDKIYKQGGDALNNFANDYVRSMKEFGASAEETYTGAALIRQGFHSIEEAAAKGVLENVAKQATELAQSVGEIPLDTHISISASGDMSVVDNATGQIQELQRADRTVIRVDADGNVEMLDKTGEQIAFLQGIGAVEIKVNAETGDVEALDKAGNVVANLSEQGEKNVNINVTANADPAKATITDLNKEKVEVSIGGNPDPAQQVINGLNNQTITLNVKTNVKPNARGTQNFSGGLALVNDDGHADPRELIIDRGRAFIPEGRDVILPLSRGAKVYTSEQTKAIMSGLGIPRYASGKNNSDAFTTAKDNWSHYTKTHSVTTEQELQKWLEFQEKYKENEKDIWDIEEQIFSIQKKLYSERVSESEKWLKHEEKYNGMSVSDYLAGIDRMKAYTAEYYAQGIINHKEYTEAIADLDEKYLDKRKEQLSELYDLSTAYVSEHSYFNDWDDIGDDPLAAYNRVMDRHKDALANGDLTQKEYDEYASKLGSDMLSQRTEQSMNWLEEQRKYFGMSDAEYVEGLERIKEYTQEYYDKGLINRREYNEAMTDLNHSMWDEALDAYDDMLKRQQDSISEMREQFQKEEQALQDSWAVADRKTDMSEVQAQLDIYSGAVTDRGQQKYKELQEQMKQLQRDEELYNLQVRNNATIESLEADYKKLEENKANVLNELRATDMDISDYVKGLTQNISQSRGNIEGLLSTLISKFDNFKVESNSMSDNRKISYSFSQMTPEQILEVCNFAVGK